MPKNPPDISGTRSRAYNHDLEEDQVYDNNGKRIKKTTPTSRMGSLTRGSQSKLKGPGLSPLKAGSKPVGSRQGALAKKNPGVPNNAAGIDYNKGKWNDNKGRTFATADSEDGPLKAVDRARGKLPTPMMKAARAKRLSMNKGK